MREGHRSEVGITIRLERLRVLLVEDEPALARVLSATALSAHDVVHASDGAAALRVIEEPGRTFDVVVSDLHMPWTNGIELHRALVARGCELASRFVMMSGATRSAAHQAYLDEQRVPFLEKPFPPQALERAIARAMIGARGARAIGE